uniref:(northern house mosquito) hypothetical protein n=1 Tax=Culex pipiens TaxID=7175 RepID=A0A8D8EYZ7_CULPI
MGKRKRKQILRARRKMPKPVCPRRRKRTELQQRPRRVQRKQAKKKTQKSRIRRTNIRKKSRKSRNRARRSRPRPLRNPQKTSDVRGKRACSEVRIWSRVERSLRKKNQRQNRSKTKQTLRQWKVVPKQACRKVRQTKPLPLRYRLPPKNP